MKRTIILALLLINASVFAQSPTVDKLTARQKVTSPLFLKPNSDTLVSKLDTATSVKNGSLSKYLYNKITTSETSQWEKSGSNIYYNTGNVGINNASPSYKLDVGGLIGGSNIETNTTTRSVKLGIGAGLNEYETWEEYNVFVGYESGYYNTTGYNNVFVGYESGYSNTTGYNNVFAGDQSGYSNIEGGNNVFAGYSSGYNNTTGYGNVFAGDQSGYSNIEGGNNVFAGYSSGYNNTTGHNNVIIGNYARYYGASFSNELVIDNQLRGASLIDSLLYRNNSLIYGQFDADTLNQFVDINGRLRHTATTAEIYRHVDSTARTQSIPNGTTPTKIVVFSDNGVSSHCTADAANDKITITKPGVYDVKLSISYASGTINVNWFGLLFLNGSVLPNIHSQWNSSASNQFRPTTLSGKIRVTSVPVDLDYRVKHDYGSAVNLTFISANLNVNYIGE